MSQQRDTFKDAAYWHHTIHQSDVFIQECVRKIASPAISPQHRGTLLFRLFEHRVERVSMLYSSGANLATLKRECLTTYEALESHAGDAFFSPFMFIYSNAYIYALQLVAWSVLFDLPDAACRRVVQIINCEGQDNIFDQLVALRIKGFGGSEQYAYPQPYVLLHQAIQSEEPTQAAAIQHFLERYRHDMKDFYGEDRHLADDLGFVGYWCFELAAFVKALQIPDSAFATHPMYPRDYIRGQP